MKVSFLLIAFSLLSRGDQLVFKNVTVIDAQAGRAQAHMTVIVTGDQISKVGRTARVKVPYAARVIDGRGKFLIPGLWDMHVHLAGPFEPAVAQTWSVPLIAAYGITGVRSMFDDLTLIRKLRDDIRTGKVMGPRIAAAGPIVDGPNPIWPGSISVATAQQGRAAVHELKAWAPIL